MHLLNACRLAVMTGLIGICGDRPLMAANQEPAASESQQTPPAPAAKPAPASARGFLLVTAAPESGLASPWLIRSLFASRELVDAVLAKHKLDDLPPERRPRIEVMPPLHSVTAASPYIQPGTCELLIGVTSLDEKLPADKLLRSVVQVLVDRLRSLDSQQQENQLRLRLLEQSEKEVSRTLNELQERYNARAAQLGVVSRDAQTSVEAEVISKTLAADVAEAALQAKLAALEQRLPQVAKEVLAETHNDESTRELMQIVKIQEEKLKLTRVQFEQGAGASQQDLLNAQSDVAFARAELAKQRRLLVDAAGAGRIHELQQRLDTTLVELQEQQGTRRALEKLAARVRRNAELDRMQLEIGAQERRYVQLLDERNRLRTKSESYRMPEVQLIPTE